MTDRGTRAHAFFEDLQETITAALAAADGGRFRTDTWTREDGGGGTTCVLEEGALFEKAGVNVSCVHGEMSEEFAAQVPGAGRRFFATGLSLIVHPRSPHVPTVHANFRFLDKGEGEGRRAWFGGGADLTPWVLYEEDAVHFHQTWQAVCAAHGFDHGRLKRWCDDYFHLPHRGETRGVGGIFFDYLGLDDAERGIPADLDDAERFVRAAGEAFVSSYLPIVERRKGAAVTDDERRWQLNRRGRYVEFNLIYDRGTIFGLKTGGRIESILVSLPNMVAWTYDMKPEPGTNQEKLVEVLRSPRDWLADG